MCRERWKPAGRPRRSPVYSDEENFPVLIGWIVWPTSAEAQIAEALRLFGEKRAIEVVERLLGELPVTPLNTVG